MAAMLASPISSHRAWGLIAAIAAAAALGVAVASERWGGLVPCALCLLERWPYRIAIVLGLAAALLPAQMARIALGLLALTMLGGLVLGVIHVGVEVHWWPSPLPECAAQVSRGGSVADLLASMPAAPSKPCDDPTYLIPGLKLSMAAMNLIFAGLVAAVTGWMAIRRPAA
jgi:disulfide bond formation protein DsbB